MNANNFQNLNLENRNNSSQARTQKFVRGLKGLSCVKNAGNQAFLLYMEYPILNNVQFSDHLKKRLSKKKPI